MVYCCWILFELVFCYVYIVETKGRSLEETAALFDGDEAIEQISRGGHAARDTYDEDEKGSGRYSPQELPKV